MDVHIVDNVFWYAGMKSASLLGDNYGFGPAHFSWIFGADPNRTCWFTDAAITIAGQYQAKRKIAWLWEPPGFRESIYQYIMSHTNEFDYILTFDRRLLERYDSKPKFLWYPVGGSMISRELWGLHPKTKMVSIIVSWKNEATGHRLRHDIVSEFASYGWWYEKVDLLGSGYGPAVRKYDALAPYCYSIVIEGERCDYFLGEKMIDALSVGTVPIYWGCPDMERFGFDQKGIIRFETIDSLPSILDVLVSEGDYTRRLPAVAKNLAKSAEYRCTEDWIWNHYPFLFDEN